MGFNSSAVCEYKPLDFKRPLAEVVFFLCLCFTLSESLVFSASFTSPLSILFPERSSTTSHFSLTHTHTHTHWHTPLPCLWTPWPRPWWGCCSSWRRLWPDRTAASGPDWSSLLPPSLRRLQEKNNINLNVVKCVYFYEQMYRQMFPVQCHFGSFRGQSQLVFTDQYLKTLTAVVSSISQRTPGL